ncbi:hypothetical protein WR25_08458 [Diploscapter pachys]|uniref:Uncharacterized protein n=1 Tax=Diploscapter pachys TaxID=2018661 RepID=A0A2A2M247_9BILA|nr:hypothetical protein WR25_08458 [Diploscapter pachys]
MIRLIDERISSIDGSALMSPIALLCPCPEFLPPLLAHRVEVPRDGGGLRGRLRGRGGDRFRLAIAREVVDPVAHALVVEHRVVQRAALQPQIARLGMAHRRQQREARDIGIAPRAHQRHLTVEQFLLRVQNLEHGDHLLRGLPHRIGRSRLCDDVPLGRGHRLQRLAALGFRLPHLCGGTTALEDRQRELQPGGRGGAGIGHALRHRCRRQRTQIGEIGPARHRRQLGQAVRARDVDVVARRIGLTPRGDEIGVEVHLQHTHVLLIERRDRLVADDVHVRGDDVGEGRRLHAAQRRPARIDTRFRRAHRILHRAALKERYGEVERAVAATLGIEEVVVRLQDVVGDGAGGGNARQPARPCDRHVFVRRALRRTLAGQRGVRRIGLGERIAQCLCLRRHRRHRQLCKARQHHAIAIEERRQAEAAIGLAPRRQSRDAAIDDAGDDAAAGRDLIDQCVGQMLDRAVHDQHVIRRARGMALSQRTLDQRDVRRARQRVLRQPEEACILFDRRHLGDDLRQDRGGIATRGADQQHAVALLQIGFGQQPAGDHRQVDRPAAGNRQRRVAIGDGARLGGHEGLARQRVHRDQHALIVHRIGPQLAGNHRMAHRLRCRRVTQTVIDADVHDDPSRTTVLAAQYTS